MTAEHRRGGQRDQPAPIKPRQGPLDGDAGKGFPLAKHADEFIAAIQSDAAEESLDETRRDQARWLRPRRRARDASAPNRPSSSRVHRKREFGDGAVGRMRRRLFAQIRRWHIFRLRSFAAYRGAGGSSLAAPSAGTDSQKPARASRPGDADAAQIDADRPPVDDNAHRLETRGSPMGSVAAR